ncbi:hypothetical protein EMEDMD4_220047 [Sinorhizobium medicae]|uniref:Uncharacterized protein n=1 Tax=Sinorhizobium medicae TaxID=110321 RepID=A0A508WVW0_9HYPH|nr:hypothetical protein EMEDMD4_220047 [Sinorhizobium medicae]
MRSAIGSCSPIGRQCACPRAVAHLATTSDMSKNDAAPPSVRSLRSRSNRCPLPRRKPSRHHHETEAGNVRTGSIRLFKNIINLAFTARSPGWRQKLHLKRVAFDPIHATRFQMLFVHVVFSNRTFGRHAVFEAYRCGDEEDWDTVPGGPDGFHRQCAC